MMHQIETDFIIKAIIGYQCHLITKCRAEGLTDELQADIKKVNSFFVEANGRLSEYNFFMEKKQG